jgi:2-dehydro-3-deoxyphosphogluconate aldolase / (4S)-4-hydroxy-2-oxoglutarate aldolase
VTPDYSLRPQDCSLLSYSSVNASVILKTYIRVANSELNQMDKQVIVLLLRQQKILPLFYHDDIEVCIGIADALCKAGMRCIEFTNRGDKALENFILLKEWLQSNHPSALPGAGTILNIKQATAFIDAGAKFIVSPATDFETGYYCTHENICWIPGAFTPTEINTAIQSDASIIKIFPGDLVNENYFKSISAVFPKAVFMLSGGVGINADEIKKWLGCGLSVLGMGGSLLTKEDIAGKNFKAIEERSKKILSQITDYEFRVAG